MPENPEHPEHPVDAVAVADYFDISKITVYRLAADGKIPSIRVGRSLRFILSEVREALTAAAH